MRVLLQSQRLIVAPESADDELELSRWKADHPGNHFQALQETGRGLVLQDLGDPRVHEPINVTSRHPDPAIRLIGNFAATPFQLDGRLYASVESFWQSLKCRLPVERDAVAALPGSEAKKASRSIPPMEFVFFRDEPVPVGSFEHWQLMRLACTAKFKQNEAARAALVATWPHPLEHRTRIDSVTIPGAVLARIWTDLRQRFRSTLESGAGPTRHNAG